ncbi:hypothetical protein CAAN3_06S05710 [[Candida] anglica]
MGHSPDSDLPPPSYEEAINPPPPSSSSSTFGRPSVPPPQPQRPNSGPSQRPFSNAGSPGIGSGSGSGSGSNSNSNSNPNPNLYGNAELPFQYPKGFLCSKCKNSGYKVKKGGMCTNCWMKFYISSNAYNPNPRLPFKYPKRYLCEKCENTGHKKKNGKTCTTCWERYAPRNNPQMSSMGSFNPFLGGGVTTAIVGGNGGPGGGPAMRVPPGDPRLGGQLCGGCRGSGLIRFLLDEELCPVCSGLGRVLNVPAPMQQFQQFTGFPPPQPQFQPYPSSPFPPPPNGKFY